MKNGPTKAEFWRAFIMEHCQYPATGRLRAQFEAARFDDFCDCGCNSFAVVPDEAAAPLPLIAPGSHGGLIFEADFTLDESRSLEVLLFADAQGLLNYVEIDCNANSEPVPETVEVGEPYRVHASAPLLADDGSTVA